MTLRCKKYGLCAYCETHGRMTKEHVVPRCFGGVYKIQVCASCNNKRGNLLNYEPFLKWVRSNMYEFRKAISMSRDPVQTSRWLEVGLKECKSVVY